MGQEPYHKPLLGEIHPVRKLHLGKVGHHSNQLIDKTKSIPSLKVQIRWLNITLQTAYHSWLQKRAKMNSHVCCDSISDFYTKINHALQCNQRMF